jgi:uncharacterized cupredoxin-like copper-binding protein
MPGRSLLVGTVVVAAVLAAAGAASAGGRAYAPPRTTAASKTYRLTASLDAGQEVPHPHVTPAARDAGGSFAAMLTLNGTEGTLDWHLTFGHLTGRATAAHVHLGVPGKAGPVAIPLCGPCSSGAHGVFHGTTSGHAKLFDALLHRGAYVNVHTALNPAGEIRGQIEATEVARATATRRAAVAISAREVEWGIELSRKTVPAGRVSFTVTDAGKLAHQFIVLRTNRAPNRLPMAGAVVDLRAAGTVVGRIDSINPGAEAHLTVTLTRGRYVLLCNLPAHYKAGQFAPFTVS